MSHGAKLNIKYLFPSTKDIQCKRCSICEKAIRDKINNKCGLCPFCKTEEKLRKEREKRKNEKRRK